MDTPLEPRVSEVELQVLTSAPQSSSRDHAETLCETRKLRSGAVEVWEIVILTCFNFPYGFICGTFGLWLIPAEATRLVPQTASTTVGFYLGLVGCSQLVCPIAGLLSDRHPSSSRFARRKPYLLFGTAAATVGTIGMWLSSIFYWTWAYPLSLMFGMLALNLAYSVDCGLVPDVLAPELEGRASSFVGVHTLLGSALGFAMIVFASSFPRHQFVYLLQIIFTNAAVAATCCVAVRLERRALACGSTRFCEWQQREGSAPEENFAPLPASANKVCKRAARADGITYEEEDTVAAVAHQATGNVTPSTENEASPEKDDGNVRAKEPQFLNAFSIKMPVIEQSARGETRACDSPRSYGLWRGARVAEGRNVGCVVESLQPLAQVKWKDVVAAYSIDLKSSRDFFWVFLGRTLYYVGVSVQSFMFFYLRDMAGEQSEIRRRWQLGCLALFAQTVAAGVALALCKKLTNAILQKCVYVACTVMALCYAAFLVVPKIAATKNVFYITLAVSAVYGAGNGCFFSADYALALATLPPKGNTAQAMGIWGVSGFIGSAIGPLSFGTLMDLCGRSGSSPYAYSFFGYSILLTGGIIATLGAGAVIKLVKHVY